MPTSQKFYLWKRNGTYYIGYVDERGKKRWKSSKSSLKNEALKKLTEFKALLQSEPVTKTLSQFKREFISYAEATYAKPTVDIFTIGLRHLSSLSGDCLLTQLTPQHIDRYKAKRLQAVSPTSVNVEVRGLRAVLNIALRWKLIESNPFSNVQLIRTPELPPTFFSKEDFQKLIAIISENWLKELIVFAVLTGMRRGEIINLRWQDVDLQRRLIQVQSNPSFKTKQGKRRTLPLSDVAFQLLSVRHRQSACEYVFSLNGTKVKESFVSHKLKEYVRRAKLNENLHFHSLRHTFASWLVQDGVNIYEVQKLLGHSSVKVTEVYSHLAASELYSAVNRISLPLN